MDNNLFNDLKISEEIQRAVRDLGYTETTPIQAKAIPIIMSGKDLIGNSQTGTGKTCAFVIPAIESIDLEDYSVQVLVLCPNRELAIQTCEEVRKLTKYTQGIGCVAIYGGEPIYKQIKDMKRNPQIVVGTPGRIMDHMRRRTLKLGKVKMVVLDEADEMLNMGFINDMEIILTSCPKERQTLLFSATMSREILQLTKKYQNNPEHLKMPSASLTVDNIEQLCCDVPVGYKTEILFSLLEKHKPQKSLIFCNTKIQVDRLVKQLASKGLHVDAIHGDMKQCIRSKVMDLYKKGVLDILVATDVAARGIDVNGIDAVFNYDIPLDKEFYVHRIGRTARAGKSGKAFTFACGRKELASVKDIARYTNSEIKVETRF